MRRFVRNGSSFGIRRPIQSLWLGRRRMRNLHQRRHDLFGDRHILPPRIGPRMLLEPIDRQLNRTIRLLSLSPEILPLAEHRQAHGTLDGNNCGNQQQRLKSKLKSATGSRECHAQSRRESQILKFKSQTYRAASRTWCPCDSNSRHYPYETQVLRQVFIDELSRQTDA